MTHFLLLLLTPAVFIDIGKTVISSALAFALIHSPLNSPNESNEALSSRELSNGQQYDTFSATYDNLNGGSFSNMLGIDEMRLLAGKYVYGDTLEIAVGTGLQSQYYTWSQLKSYTGIDMSQGMLSEAGNRIPQMAAKSNIKVPIDIKQMDTTKLNFADNEFDSVIDTFSMCVIDNPLEALKEMRRVVKVDGNVVLLENSVSTNYVLARLQDATEPIITPFSKGCRWNVDVPTLARVAGLEKKSGGSVQLGTIMYGIYTKSVIKSP